MMERQTQVPLAPVLQEVSEVLPGVPDLTEPAQPGGPLLPALLCWVAALTCHAYGVVLGQTLRSQLVVAHHPGPPAAPGTLAWFEEYLPGAGLYGFWLLLAGWGLGMAGRAFRRSEGLGWGLGVIPPGLVCLAYAFGCTVAFFHLAGW